MKSAESQDKPGNSIEDTNPDFLLKAKAFKGKRASDKPEILPALEADFLHVAPGLHIPKPSSTVLGTILAD